MFLYNALSSLLNCSKHYPLRLPPGRPVHSDINSTSLGSILAMQKLRIKTKSLTFLPPSIAGYSFMKLSQGWILRRFSGNPDGLPR